MLINHVLSPELLLGLSLLLAVVVGLAMASVAMGGRTARF
ncbi:MAG: hypothetical protein RJA10_4124 [Pseudomonadota bacterium]|jgi:hypothetical protein